MPRFDKTGPEGKGPRTGRGQGECEPSKSSKKQESEKIFGRRSGLGRRGRGFFRFFRRRSEEENTESE